MADGPEVIIAGDGPVANLLALALAEQGVRFAVCGDGDGAADRPIALSHGSRILLERFAVFDRLDATPIETIHVSQRGAFGRTLMRASDHGLPAFGHVVSYAELQAVLKRRVRDAATDAVFSARMLHYAPAPQGDAVLVDTASATGGSETLRARLLVLAEGGRAATGPRGARALHPARGGERRREYGQSAVVSRVRTELPHHNRAWERFTAEGPLALLPSGDELALVWSTTHETARSLCALRDAAFLARLSDAFGTRLGRFTAATGRIAFPVSLRYRRSSPLPRVLAIGNAAQTLHPVAGQGLNLGLRDAWELAHALRGADDAGAAQLLMRYLDARALDRAAGIHVTDALVRVFSNSNPALGLARGAGLAAVDILSPARRFLARRMMFGTRALP
jgi:2-octaprenyl-6-methoxyphenol hydroxylase